MLDFNPERRGPPPRDAATVVVVRDRGGLEVFCLRRHKNVPFLGGAMVFPGGKVEDRDRTLDRARTNGLHPRAAEFGSDAIALAVAALRESLEEAALLPTLPPYEHETARQWQRALGPTTAWDDVLPRTTVLDTASLVPLSRWVTPLAERRRFDARLFLTSVPTGQRGEHDGGEAIASAWLAPAE
ncbi:MAG: hypothetical protein AAGA56_25955, partial [Myxococcota bacterium]